MALILERLTADCTSLAIFTADETYGIAHRNGGAVIRGWGATHLLRQVGHAVCVRVCAPRELRVRRTMERLNTDDGNFVRREVDLSDEAHAAHGRNSNRASRYPSISRASRNRSVACFAIMRSTVS